MGIIAGLITMFFWGIAIFFAAIASRKIGNILTLFWMQVFGILVGVIYFLLNIRSLSLNHAVQFIPILLIIAFFQVIAYLAFYKGLQKGQVTLVSPLGASWSLITAVLSIVFFREILKTNQIFAILLIMIGIIVISVNLKDLIKNKSLQLLTGVKEGLISMLGWGISLFLLISVTKELGWFLPAFIFRLLMLLLLTTYILYSKKSPLPKTDNFPWKILLVIGIFDMLAFFTYSLGVSSSYGSIVAPISSANTLITIILSLIFLKEKIKLRQTVGIAAIVSGLVLISL